VPPGHEFVDALAGQLDHELTADEHREDLPPVAERAAAEPATALGWQDAVLARELIDQILVPLFRRRPLFRRHPSRMTGQLTAAA